MNVNGRHIMINCEGEGQFPPVSVKLFCEYLVDYLKKDRTMVSSISPELVVEAIQAFERGER